MTSSIWDRYQKIKDDPNNDNNPKIKTYKVKIEPIIKEIIPENEKEYYKIKGRLEKLKNKFEIIEIKEEVNKFYIVINDKDELVSKIDKLILTNEKNELNIHKECNIKGHGKPITKDEILNLFKMEESICRIEFEKIEENKLKKFNGTGFFCELEGNFPIKYALFTNNHVLDESNLEINKKINFKYFEKSIFSSPKITDKEITITKDRKTFTNKGLDYTCIEIFEFDGISNFFNIEPNIYKFKDSSKSTIFEENDIFILQFYDDNVITYSDGNIIKVIENEIVHHASTEKGSSGSPIIKRGKDNYIIGLHKATFKDEENCFNLGTTFDSILDNIKEQFNEINCIYIPNTCTEEIYLIHDYSYDTSKWKDKNKKKYREAKEMNKNLFENYIELYVNDKKIDFNFKYKFKESKVIKVKFKFKKILANMSYIFFNCSSLKSIDLSSFNTNHVNNMSSMFDGCSSLESIDLSSFNTSNVIDMSYMFNYCISLKSLDLSSFNTSNVNNMSAMFQDCSSLKSIDLSSFNTNNVNDMSRMFSMYRKCSSFISLDLSSFNTSNVIDMKEMFYKCSSLKSLDLSKFVTNNVKYMTNIFFECSSLKKENIKINNSKDKILSCF